MSLIPRAHHRVYSTMKKRDARELRWKAINRDSSDPRNFSIGGAHMTKSALMDLSIRYVETLCLSHERNRNRSKSDKSPSTIMVDRKVDPKGRYLFSRLFLLNASQGRKVSRRTSGGKSKILETSLLSSLLRNVRFVAI